MGNGRRFSFASVPILVSFSSTSAIFFPCAVYHFFVYMIFRVDYLFLIANRILVLIMACSALTGLSRAFLALDSLLYFDFCWVF